ncbi:MAG: VWA domain-containing protein [Myxococcota bacterium]|nr:VWA domain-containing protein [Myxococcota bacterium]
MKNSSGKTGLLSNSMTSFFLPFVRLLKSDWVTFRKWSKRAGELEKKRGRETVRQGTEFLCFALGVDTDLARDIPYSLADSLLAVEESDLERFFSVLLEELERPDIFRVLMRTLPSLLDRFCDTELNEFIAHAKTKKTKPEFEAFLNGESASAYRMTSLVKKTVLEEKKASLTLYARAHCGADVDIRISERSFCDGKHIYLPPKVSFSDPALAYRVLTARNAGYIEFGTLNFTLSDMEGEWAYPRPDELEIERLFRSFGNSSLAQDLFFIIENARVEHLLRHEYPGVARDMEILGKAWRPPRPRLETLAPVPYFVESLYRLLLLGEDDDALRVAKECFRTIKNALNDRSSVQDTISLLKEVYPMAAQFFGTFPRYNRLSVSQERGMMDASALSKKDRQQLLAQESQRRIRTHTQKSGQEFQFKEVSEFFDRMPGPSGPARTKQKTAMAPKLEEESQVLVGQYVYPEWDETIQEEKPKWTSVQELRVFDRKNDFVDGVRLQYRAEIQHLRKSFFALRPENWSPLRGREDGESIDFDRLIAAKIARRNGENDMRFYIRKHRLQRSVSVAFLIDMSSSTNELIHGSDKKIIDVEKEALAITAEALDALGDSFAIYGFSGYGRRQVAFYIAKEFTDSWNETTQNRLGNMNWKMENRDGAAIRHCCARLEKQKSKTKILILLSDGKPLDCGGSQYADSYAQADTKKALLEVKKRGIYPFCITVDPDGADYLAQMYGKHGFIVLERVEKLPTLMPQIYRRLTL